MRRAARKVWTKAEIALLVERYADRPTRELAILFGVSSHQTFCKAYALGLRKSVAYLASLQACRLRRGDQVGVATRFQAGRVSWNKGLKYTPGGRAHVTQFKRGSQPPNYVPVGSERVNDGYLQRKMTQTGYPPRDWVAVHNLMWVEQHGAIPKGHVVVFRNGHRTDLRLDNLELISRAQLMQRNTIHRYPQELKQVIRLSKKLNRTIKRVHEKQD